MSQETAKKTDDGSKYQITRYSPEIIKFSASALMDRKFTSVIERSYAYPENSETMMDLQLYDAGADYLKKHTKDEISQFSLVSIKTRRP